MKNHVERAHWLFLIHTGCTGPILNQDLAAKHQIPVHKRDMPIDRHNAHGEIIPAAEEYYTHRLDMIIGKHEETLHWDLGPLQDEMLGYLWVSWMDRHNSDINWTTGTHNWRSDFCHKHYLPAEVKLELITEA